MHPDFIDEILSYEEWKNRTQTSQPTLSQFLGKKTQSAREPKYRHKPQDEKRPGHVFFTLNATDMDTKMEHMMAKVPILLGGQAYEDIEEIHALTKKMLQLKPGPEKHDWSYALVGKHGEGKSTVTNCLLGRYNLAGVSKGTKSCTQFATEFRYKSGAADDTDKSDVTIAFFDNSQLKAIVEENVMRYGNFHYPTNKDEEDDDESLEPAFTRMPTKHDEVLSKEAYDLFRIIVKEDDRAEQELEEHLKCPESFVNGSLVDFLLRQQQERLQALGVDDTNTITYLNVPDKLGPEHEQGKKDIAAVRKVSESLAPVVKLVTVATGGLLLRYGLVLVDIPGKLCIAKRLSWMLTRKGYGDLNQARTASANMHRRSAHGEIIIGAAPRIEDSEDLYGQVFRSRKAHGDLNTVLVMNQIDKAYDLPDIEAVFYEIKENKESPFSELLRASDNDPAAEDAYFEYVGKVAQSAMIRQSAQPTEDELKKRHGGRISVFSVVASAAHEWLDEYRAADPTWGPLMSGIPHLKRGLLSLTAEQKLQIYHKHYFQTLPGAVDDVQRILTKTAGRIEVLAPTRRSLEQCFQNAIRGSRANREINNISIVLPIYTESEKDTIIKRINALIQVWSESTVVKFNTFMHTLACKGIPTSYTSAAYRSREDINWNRDLLETMEAPASKSHAYISTEAHLSVWKAAMKKKSAEIANSITSPVTDLWASVEEIISASSAPSVLKRRTRSAWKRVENDLRDMVNHFHGQITAAIDKVHTEITTEEDVECMIAKMNVQAYENAEYQRRGPRVYTRQRQSLTNSLCTLDSNLRTFVDRYESAAKRIMNERIAQVSEKFIVTVDSKLKEFIRITEQFIQTDAYNTTQHADARKILRSWLVEFQDLLLDCQRQFPGQQYQQDVHFMGSIKRAPSSECEESAMKKIKVEDESENSTTDKGKTDNRTADESTTDESKTAPSCDGSTSAEGRSLRRSVKEINYEDTYIDESDIAGSDDGERGDEGSEHGSDESSILSILDQSDHSSILSNLDIESNNDHKDSDDNGE
ncbi:hypothetical protein SLS60_001382 [Paraconiothyrium brasiliense]|uniref:G domain-containing protein n=1 Tax=Paraconiothyrium brasiliense TaxID=300254 RepID=A0ABR3S8Y8_9PLEO